MSNLNIEFLKKICNNPASLELKEKFYEIFKDMYTFENETFEEDSREDKRIKANKKIIKILKEARKIVPFSDLLSDITKFMALAEATYIYSEAVSTKLVVSLQLYYKSLEILGTEIHNEWRKRCEDGTDLGCFGLTELGHGSNVRGIMTTAHYAKLTKEFIINTPEEKAMKFWIGGAAKTANVSVIFAQLYVDGKCHGPHAFVIPIRDKSTHMPLPGVILGDCGKKEGLDAIDNGFMIFNNFRVPKENLLNRFSNIT